MSHYFILGFNGLILYGIELHYYINPYQVIDGTNNPQCNLYLNKFGGKANRRKCSNKLVSNISGLLS